MTESAVTIDVLLQCLRCRWLSHVLRCFHNRLAQRDCLYRVFEHTRQDIIYTYRA